jgi:predicted transcriptional regulator of viral defense system
MNRFETSGPDWDHLYSTALGQDGFFTTKQALEAGYSLPLLVHYLRIGRAVRVRRGVYRLIHFPAGDHDELVIAWLWSEQNGVISHQTALALHGLSDSLPTHIHLTLPIAWRRRRFRVPTDIVLHHADIPQTERTWIGAVPIANPRRALRDCAQAALSPDLLRQAAQQALSRGLVTKVDLEEVETALKPFGGIET